MAEEEKKKSFWETLPGIITALAALIGAIATLIAALNSEGKEGAAKTETPAAQAAPAVRKAVAEEQAKAQPAAPKQGDITTDGFTGMKLAYVPGGCFMMGSSADDKDHQDDEGPAHEVCVDSFWMGQFEVTQGQWEKVMGANPSGFKKGGNYPVEQVSWEDAQEFIKKLNSRAGKSYRLPTEAEWEYACRANGSSKYCGGDDVGAVAWHGEGMNGSTHAAGGKQANAFGLYDMSGNVWEWCADWHDSGYYASSPKENPQGPDSSENRVLRGGSWFFDPLYCRAVNRNFYLPEFRFDDFGFRLVLPFQQGEAGR